MTIDKYQRLVKLLQNWSPEAPYFLFLQFGLKKVSGRSNIFIISKRQSRSAVHFTTETIRCRSGFQYCWHCL